jgi:Ni2+-binding GTPase involved in maturation of urease and hydrogenase
MTTRADYIMLGGFLGAGKTTAILALADWLSERKRTVGLITNDQSVGLVDTAMLSAHGYPVEEITGGCFCCRFNSLMEASEKLTEDAKPEVFLAEPVGSCTDLRAAVSHPLRRLYGDDFRVAPLSVLLDPIRAARILGLEQGAAFSPKVRYVYEKQLEEAEVIVINKQDLVDGDQLARLKAAIADRYPRAKVFVVSARDRAGLDEWFSYVLGGDAGEDPAPDIDYEEYAEGEALLGWYNGTATLSVKAEAGDAGGDAGVDGNRFLTALAETLRGQLASKGIDIAHLKMTLSPTDFGSDIAVLNLVRTDGRAELSHTLKDPVGVGELIVNLRAEGAPDVLRAAAGEALASVAREANVDVTIDHEEAFRPGKPNPTYRMASATA